MLRFHAQTAGSTLTAQQPDNNVARVTLQALAAVLGGTQSLHTNSRDEALALPSESSARLALRTQQVIAFESGVARHPDPFAGSYVVEDMTDRLESEATSLLREIDGLGGMVAAIERGFPQREIQNAAYAAQLAVDRKEAIVVGVNDFAEKEPPPTGLLRVDPAIEAAQVARLQKLRARRDDSAVRDALDGLQQTAVGTGNLMPPILHAVESLATLGEIADTLRAVFGEYQEIVTL